MRKTSPYSTKDGKAESSQSLSQLVRGKKWNIDAGRHMIEQISPIDYMRMSYYEKWLVRDIDASAGRPSVVSIPPSPLSISCRKPMAGLFAGDLERYHRITAPPAPGQAVERVLHHVAQQFHRILPAALAARGAVGFEHSPHPLDAPGLEATPLHREVFLSTPTVLVSSATAGHCAHRPYRALSRKDHGLPRPVAAGPWA
jgi:hypothetical protein